MRIREGEARYLIDLLRRDHADTVRQLSFLHQRNVDKHYSESARVWRNRQNMAEALLSEVQRTAEEMDWRLDR